MARPKTKIAKWATVRIWKEPKGRLEKVVEAKIKKEKRLVTETELVNKAVSALCDTEEAELGLKKFPVK